MRADLRPATRADHLAILGMMIRSHTEAAAPMAPLDVARCVEHMFGVMREGFAQVAIVESQVVGVLLGVKHAPWWSRQERASDLFTYVAPEARGSGAALALYRAFRRWAHERGLKLALGQLTGVETERVEKIFTRLGLVRSGAMYVEE